MELFQKLHFDQKPVNRKFLPWGLGLFFCFLLLSAFEVTFHPISRFDPQITQAAQTIIPRAVDLPFSVFSLVGTFEVISIVMAGLALYIFKKEKKIVWSLSFFVVVLVFELIGKSFIFHPGPPKQFFRYDLPFNISTVHLSTNFAYPSGHIARTMFVSILLIFMANRYAKGKSTKTVATTLILLFTAVMVVSRVYLGEHWTSDVFGGFLLGSSMGLLSLVYY